MFARVTEKIFDLRGREVGGSSAAPVELQDFSFTGNALAHTRDFLFQHA